MRRLLLLSALPAIPILTADDHWVKFARGPLEVLTDAEQARLTIQSADGKLVRLLIAEPGKVAYSGAGEVTLGCGVQKARRVAIEYFPKPDSKLATAGEVATIEFQ